MPNSILVPLDGSVLAERALPYAEQLAKMRGDKLVLARAVQARIFPGVDPSDRQIQLSEQAEAYLQQVAKRLTERGLTVDTAVPYGPAADEILDEVKIRRPNMVVMATHGRSGLGRSIYGSVADAVLRRIELPLVLVPAACKESPRVDQPMRVLVCLDGSALAEQALDEAQELAPGADTTYHLVRLVEPVYTGMYGEAAPYVYGTQEMDLTSAEAYLETMAQRLRAGGRNVTTAVSIADPAGAIVAAANDEKVDYIAMATHGRGGLARLVLGSVASGVVQRAQVPLLLIRPKELVEATEVSELTEQPPADTAEALPGEPVEPSVRVALSPRDLDLIERGLNELMFEPGADPRLAEPARTLLSRLRQTERELGPARC